MSDSTILDPKQRFEEIAPNIKYTKRLRKNISEAVRIEAMRFAGKFPGLGFLKERANAPRDVLMHSGSPMMYKFYTADYGTPDKPSGLEDIPWEYVAEKQEEIPFFGLREYWYPIMKSEDLPNNEPKAARILGDNIVLFRDGDGKPCALENRCPHRSPLLSLGQVNVYQKGTITCRYHGMTFNKEGECVAFLADGPDSPACGKVKAKAYPAVEEKNIIFVYMGTRTPVPDIRDNLPHAKDILGEGLDFCLNFQVPYSYLNQLDNATDMTHVGVLHRSCALFGDQKLGGGVAFEEIEFNGVKAGLREQGGHAGGGTIDWIRWYPPNLAYHGDEFMNGMLSGMWFWFVPNDIGSFTAWNIATFNPEKAKGTKSRVLRTVMRNAIETSERFTGSNCFGAGDGPMQMSQGRVVRWDQEHLARTDRAVLRTRDIMKRLHKQEQEDRKAKGLDGLAHRVSAQQFAVNGTKV